MSAPVDDFDLDIRLSTTELTGSGEGAAMVLSQVQTNCNSACLTNCHASECRCNQ